MSKSTGYEQFGAASLVVGGTLIGVSVTALLGWPGAVLIAGSVFVVLGWAAFS